MYYKFMLQSEIPNMYQNTFDSKHEKVSLAATWKGKVHTEYEIYEN